MATAAATDHRGKGFFIFKGGWEYTAVVAAAAVALAGSGAGVGPAGVCWAEGALGAKTAIGAAMFGVGNAALLLATSYRPKRRADLGPRCDFRPFPHSSIWCAMALCWHRRRTQRGTAR